MYFRLGGGTVKGVSKPGWIVWSRVFVEGGKLKFDTGLADHVEPGSIEQAGQTFTQQHIVVRDHHPRRRFARRSRFGCPRRRRHPTIIHP